MKKVIGVAIALMLVCGVVGCSALAEWDIGKYLGSIEVMAAETSSTITVAGNIMAVFYTLDEGRILFWCTEATITDNGDGTWDVTSPQVVARGISQTYADYGLYQLQEIAISYDDDGIPTPIYMSDLDLQPVSADDLPHSLHVAALESVALVDGSPRATVTRLYMGQEYQVLNCRVSLQAYTAYTGGQITLRNHSYGLNAPENANCFVLVYFITEAPFSTAVNIPVVIDKVIK